MFTTIRAPLDMCPPFEGYILTTGRNGVWIVKNDLPGVRRAPRANHRPICSHAYSACAEGKKESHRAAMRMGDNPYARSAFSTAAIPGVLNKACRAPNDIPF